MMMEKWNIAATTMKKFQESSFCQCANGWRNNETKTTKIFVR